MIKNGKVDYEYIKPIKEGSLLKRINNADNYRI